MKKGDTVVVSQDVKLPRRDATATAKDLVMITVPAGTAGQIVGASPDSQKFKVEVTGGLLNGRRYWIWESDLKLAN